MEQQNDPTLHLPLQLPPTTHPQIATNVAPTATAVVAAAGVGGDVPINYLYR